MDDSRKIELRRKVTKKPPGSIVVLTDDEYEDAADWIEGWCEERNQWPMARGGYLLLYGRKIACNNCNAD